MYDRKCIDGDSDHQTSTGIQRHRLRALFERDDYGNTAGADGLNTGRMVLKNRNVEVGSYVSARYVSFFNAGGTADNLNYSPRNTIIVFRGFSFFIRGAPDQKKE